MALNKEELAAFDPRNPNWRGRFWVKLRTPNGKQVFVNWPRVIKLAVVLAIMGWLGLAGAVWGYVKYRRGVASVSFVDIAFLPLRYSHYRESLSRHYLALGQKQQAAGQWSQAVFSLRQAVAKDPSNPDARLALARLFDTVQRTDLGIKTLEVGLPQGRGQADYIRTLFALLQKQDDSARIIALGREILPRQSPLPPAYREIAEVVIAAEIERHQIPEARTLVKTWFTTDSLHGSLLMARLDEASGYPDLAAMQLEALLSQYPKNERLCLQLIQLYQHTGHLNEARRVATIRSLQHPDSPGAACDLISLLYETGATEAAQRELAGFFEKFSDDERALMLIANAALRLKMPALARQVRQHAPHDESGHVPLPFLLVEMAANCRAHDYAGALKLAGEVDQYGSLPPQAQGAVNQLRCWASYGLGENGQGEFWLNQFLSLGYPNYSRDALALVSRLREVPATAPARRILQALLDRNADDRPALLALVQLDLEQQSWSEVSRRVPLLLSLDPAPTKLLQTIWLQGQDHLTLTPELKDRLRHQAH